MQTRQTNGHNSDMQSTTKTLNHSCNNDFQEIKIPMPWGHIAGKWWGPSDMQPILAIHGWQDNAGSFDALAPLIVKEKMSVLCIDLPGHGLSSSYPEGMYYYIFWDGIHIVKRILKHFNWDKVKLLGHSLGGIISFLYASAYPTEVECFICIDIASPAVRDPIGLVGKIGSTISTFLKYENLPKGSQPSYEYDEMVDTAVEGYKGSCTRQAVELLLKRGMKPAGGGKFVFTRDVRLKAVGLGMIGIDETLEMAKAIKCRVLNIRGDPGMSLERPEYYDMVLDELEKSAATMERHVVKGMHHLHLNDAESISSMVTNFLKNKKE